MATPLKPLRSLPSTAGYKAGDVLVVFGELFARGYANGIVDEAEKKGMTIVRSTVGRRDADGRLRALTTEELATWPKPYINIPLEAGFDMEPSADGTKPVDQLAGVKMNEWNQVKLDWEKMSQSRSAASARFRASTERYMKELEGVVPKGASVLFVHTMAGGVPRAKILMPTMNKVFKGTGDRYIPSERFAASEIGKLSAENFEEVTANTFQHLLEASQDLRARIEKDGGQARYVAYGYHGTEVLMRGEYRWQTYTCYFQGDAKMKLENYARAAWNNGIKATVFNCPEILTNSSSIFLGVEVSLYPLMGALRKEAPGSPHIKQTLAACQTLLKDGHTLDEILTYTDQYLTSSLIQSYCDFQKWPQHNGKEQMEYMLDSSAHLIDMHKDAKNLITYRLSEEVFKACGLIMLNESWTPKEPVWWIGHDVLAKALAMGAPA